jgi:hypothetical protein
MNVGTPTMLWQRVTSWRFWTLVAVAVIDGVFFIIPMMATALIVCALIAPDLLRRIARFLDSLATAS